MNAALQKEEPEQQQCEEESGEQVVFRTPFDKEYQGKKCLFTKFDNKDYNSLRGVEYFASLFIDRRLLKENKVLQNDTNSKGNTQWFYFTVSNLPKDVDFTFNIVNLIKCDSLFNYGMLPAVMSEVKLKKTGQGWERTGKSVSYERNQIRKEKSRRNYYTLSFKLSTKYTNDTLHIAHCYPYTLTMLNQYLESIFKSNQASKKILLHRTIIGRTVANNPIEAMTVTEQFVPPSSNKKQKDNRKYLIVMARQHPGQSQGSYVCQGFINFVVGKSKEAEFLRKNFIIKIIPMVNPDGVVFGNYRTNLMGYDLNRKWDLNYDKSDSCPEVMAIKNYITQLNKDKRVRFILDLHGHSKKLNSFFYGNPCPPQPEAVRAFPYTCSKLNPQICYQDCTFTIQQQKKKAARVYLSLAHHLVNVYTFQSSFYGYLSKENKKIAYTVEDFRGLGNTLGLGLFWMLEYESYGEKTERGNTLFNKFLTELRDNPNLLLSGQNAESGSESKPQEFEIVEAEVESINKKYQEKIAQLAQTMDQNQDETPSTAALMTHDPPSQSREKLKPKSLGSVSSKIESRKGKRDQREVKNPRQLKVMEISRVNSILPDKYQMALEPALRQDNQVDSNKKTAMRKSIKDLRLVSTHAQTLPIAEDEWQELKQISIQSFLRSENSRPSSASRNKDSFQIKYVSLTDAKCKKNVVLKLDFAGNTTSSLMNHTGSISNLKQRNTHSQTILSCVSGARGRYQKFKSITHLPQVETDSNMSTPSKSQHPNFGMNASNVSNSNSNNNPFPFVDIPSSEPKIRLFRTTRLSHRRDNQDFLNDMVKKYLIDLKDKNNHQALLNQNTNSKVRPLGSHQDRIFCERSLPPRFQDLSQKPLSIKKKEIFIQKKQAPQLLQNMRKSQNN